MFLLTLIAGPGWWALMNRTDHWTVLSQSVAHHLLGIAFGLTAAWLVIRILDVFVWSLLERRIDARIPRLLKDTVAVLILAMAVIMILRFVFAQNVAVFWTTSGVVGIVLGLALRSMIADVFYGIAINVDRPFKLGQWVEIRARGLEPVIGSVTEVSWRCTRLRTTDHTVLVVPNSLIGTMILRNLSEPETKSRFELVFCLEFGVPSERALRVLEAGLKAAEGPLTDPAPTVRIDNVSDRGVEYKVRYWLEPAQLSPPRARHAVTSSILRHLHQAGLSLAYDKQDVYLSRMPARQLDRTTDRSTIIQRIEMFSLLSADERQQLACDLQERRFAPGEPVVQQGEEGESMYILVEGLLEVRSTLHDDLTQVKVSVIEPGQCFGEMSLLTGEPRTATVVAVTSTIAYELNKENLNALLSRRPEIAAEIAELMAKRRVQLKAAGQHSQERDVATRQSLTDQILDRMRHVFSSLRNTLISRH